MLGTLYIVATPIGNLGDISARALETLKSVDYILSEDTRRQRILLDHYAIKKLVISYHQHSSDAKKDEILLDLLNGKKLALVTDAGTPGVSDPGNELIDYLLSKDPNILVVPIPGPSSITTALSVCGFKAGEFVFLGYAPKKGRTKFLDEIKTSSRTVVFFESPYRLLKLIDKLEKEIGSEKRICVCQELTKMHERVLRGTFSEVKEILITEEKELGRVKGEIVVILAS